MFETNTLEIDDGSPFACMLRHLYKKFYRRYDSKTGRILNVCLFWKPEFKLLLDYDPSLIDLEMGDAEDGEECIWLNEEESVYYESIEI